MLTVTTGGTIAEASDIVDDADIDNQGEAIHKTAATQNNTVIGMQESANITLTIALPVGTASTTAETNAGRNFSSLATDAIAVGTIVK